MDLNTLSPLAQQNLRNLERMFNPQLLGAGFSVFGFIYDKIQVADQPECYC